MSPLIYIPFLCPKLEKSRECYCRCAQSGPECPVTTCHLQTAGRRSGGPCCPAPAGWVPLSILSLVSCSVSVTLAGEMLLPVCVSCVVHKPGGSNRGVLQSSVTLSPTRFEGSALPEHSWFPASTLSAGTGEF